jgi:hypothetical protein
VARLAYGGEVAKAFPAYATVGAMVQGESLGGSTAVADPRPFCPVASFYLAPVGTFEIMFVVVVSECYESARKGFSHPCMFYPF